MNTAIENLTEVKPANVPPAPPSSAKVEPSTRLPGQTLRLNKAARKQLKQLALDEEVVVHYLLIEGVNMVFAKRGLPQIA